MFFTRHIDVYKKYEQIYYHDEPTQKSIVFFLTALSDLIAIDQLIDGPLLEKNISAVVAKLCVVFWLAVLGLESSQIYNLFRHFDEDLQFRTHLT